MLVRILLSAVLLLAAYGIDYVLQSVRYVRLALFVIPYLFIGWDILWRAVRNIAHGQVFDENFLMALATVGAFGIGEYPEAVFVMLFYQVGELFQGYAVGRSRQSIASLMDIRPDYANIEVDGELKQVDPEEVAVGDIIVIKAGERIPLDGTVLDGSSMLDTAVLTGESIPRAVGVGNDVISGCVNLNGLLRVRVSRVFGESTATKILDLVENAASKKAKTENFITRFARVYTPLVVIAAALLALVPPLLYGGWSEWLHRALVFLVISCPCALVISVPLSFFGGIGSASRCGILVKGGSCLEALAQLQILVFDKTGTLTQGSFRVTAVHTRTLPEERLLELAALAESYSDHPISVSLRDACPTEPDRARIAEVEELSGRGVRTVVDGHTVCVGNDKLMRSVGVALPECSGDIGTIVHVSVDRTYGGHIVISDEVKEDAALAITELKTIGICKTVMLTGDAKAVGERVAGQLGMDEVYSELLPADKVERVEELLLQKTGKGRLAFVGDGINDAPVLSRADVGIAMGGLGSDAAIEAADVVLMDDKPSKIAVAIRIAKKTIRIAKQNIVFALLVKVLVLGLGAFGFADMWSAVFADVGVSVLAILNASRTLQTPHSVDASA